MVAIELAISVTAAIKLAAQLIEAARASGLIGEAQAWEQDLADMQKQQDVAKIVALGKVAALIIAHRMMQMESLILQEAVANNPASQKPAPKDITP